MVGLPTKARVVFSRLKHLDQPFRTQYSFRLRYESQTLSLNRVSRGNFAQRYHYLWAAASCFALLIYWAAQSAQSQHKGKAAKESYEVYVPETVPPESQYVLRMMRGPQGLPLPGPDDLEAWKKLRSYVPPQLQAIAKDPEISKRTTDTVKRYPSTSKKGSLGGVPVLEIAAENWRENGKVMVYVHGGGYVTGGPEFGLGGWVSGETGLRIISVGYTLAPESEVGPN